MAISFQCPWCKRTVQAPDHAAGKMGKCPGCRQTIPIPARKSRVGAVEPPVSPPAYTPIPPTPDVDIAHAPRRGVAEEEALPAQILRRSGMAIASLVLGLLGLVLLIFAGLPALILGIAALVSILRSKGTLTGKGMAIAGTILGALSIPLTIVVAAIVIPNLLRAQSAANEAATIGSLKTIATQEAIFKMQAEIDQDVDGIGEHGLLGELSGAFPPRGKGAGEEVVPVYLPQAFHTQGGAGNGLAEKRGYYYRIYLAATPTTADDDTMGGTVGGAGGESLDSRAPTGQAAINIQEACFACYAWPVEFRKTGQRAFVATEVGEVYWTKMEAKTYSGTNGPSMEAAFPKDGNGSDGWFNDRLGGDVCNDGNRWTPAGR